MSITFTENKISNTTDINTEIEAGDRTSQLNADKRIVGVDREGKSITEKDTVEIHTSPYQGIRGTVSAGSENFNECIVEWYDGKTQKFKKKLFKTENLKKIT